MTDKHFAAKHTRDSRLFSYLANHQFEDIFAATTREKIPKGRIVIRQGEKANRLYLLSAGYAKYYRLTKRGNEVLLWSLSSGDTFGLVTLLREPPPYIGTAEATRECDLYSWEHAAIRSLARKYPQLAENSLRIVLQYLSNHAERLASLVSETAEQRLARALLHLGHNNGCASGKGVQVEATNEHIGALANVSPFTASRLLKKWERAGAVVKRRGEILIHHPEKLVID